MTTTYTLPQERVPRAWYNLVPDLPEPPAPPLHPATRRPAGPDDLAPLFPEELIRQEVSLERWVEIPQEVRQVLQLWRPTPLVRAQRWEKALDTPARIYFKNESVSPAGSHKPNTAVPQAYYNRQAGIRRLTTETGAGQWGSALSLAAGLFGLECLVYMVKVSYQQKPYRRSMIRAWGADVLPSPSDTTAAGRAALAADPDTPGSLGLAISEAVEVAASAADTHYALGSVLNHVLLHQSVIGLEALEQLDEAGDYPDVLVACVGGGSNFAGLAFPFLGNVGGKGIPPRVIAVEPTACPTLTQGRYDYDFGDSSGLTPLLKMHTLGHDFVPPGIHAGGLRYHGMAPLVSAAVEQGLVQAEAVPQLEAFAAALSFARAQGIVPAPESSHALASVVRQAARCREAGVGETILFNLSGHGHFDMSAYDAYLAGNLEDTV